MYARLCRIKTQGLFIGLNRRGSVALSQETVSDDIVRNGEIRVEANGFIKMLLRPIEIL